MSTEKDLSTRTHTQRKDKAKISLSVDSEIYAKSHALGINVSKACENYLKELINAIENRNNMNVLGKASSQEGLVRSPRFEPGSSAWQADVLDQTRLRPHFTGLRNT